MTPNQLMIERLKEIILKDCIDLICVTEKRIKKYLKDDRRSKERDYIYGVKDSTISINESVELAINELVSENKVTKVGSTFRKKYKSEY